MLHIAHMAGCTWLAVERRDPHRFADGHSLLAKRLGQNGDYGIGLAVFAAIGVGSATDGKGSGRIDDVLCVLATAGCDRRIGSKRTLGHSAGSEDEGDG